MKRVKTKNTYRSPILMIRECEQNIMMTSGDVKVDYQQQGWEKSPNGGYDEPID